ncbi:MAG: LPS export ABC transporter permease LptF [Pseudomonadota bacterium]
MGTAARYLNRELLSVFLVVLAVLLVMAMGGRFIGYLQEAAAGKFNAGNLLLLLGYRLPEFAQLLLPFSLSVAVVMTLGRSFADQEMTIFLGGGLSAGRLAAWHLPLILAVTALVAWCALDLNPRWQRLSYQLLQSERADRDFANLRPGVFHVYSRGDRVSYADGIDDTAATLKDVFLSERRPAEVAVVVRASEGRQYLDPNTGSRFLLLSNGSRFEGRAGTAGYRTIEFERMGQRIEIAQRLEAEQRATLQSTAALLEATDPAALAEFGYRCSLPALTFIGGLLAIGISPTRPRQGRFARLPVAIGFFVAYYLLLVLQKDLVGSAVWPAELAYWPAHGLFALLAWRQLDQVGSPRRG